MKFIIIKSVAKPESNDPDLIIKWFCQAFGLESEIERDDSIEERLLKKFIDLASEGKGISSSEIKLSSNIPRTTIIYHLNILIDMGLIIKKGRKYYLRANEFSSVIEEIEYDLNREMMRLLDTAKEFDKLKSLSNELNKRKRGSKKE
jgi:predicted transcriptional regulator